MIPLELDERIHSLEPHAEPQPHEALREFLEGPRDEQTACALLKILDQLVDAAAHNSQREENQPYLSEVLAGSPNTSREIETLRSAGDAGHVRIEDLREHVVRQLSQARVSEAICQELRDWSQSQTAHRRHENRLINESINRDTGGES